LLEVGLGRGLIQDRVRSGRLLLVHRGVYSLGHRRFDLHHRWMAAVLACGPRAVLSHRSAGHLWGLRGWRGSVEVTRPSGGTARRGIRVLQRRLDPLEVTAELGIPVTTIERTLLDIARYLDRRQLTRAIAAGQRSGRLHWGKLTRVIAEGDGCAGIERLRHAAGDADPRAADARSGIEVDFLALCGEAGLPLPACNVLVEGHMVDFLWPARRVVVELDSYRFHGDPAAFERDRETTLALEAAGYRVPRVTERMLTRNPNAVVSRLRRALSDRSSDRPRDTWRS
jgi:Protein of unknown function (DUF559)